MNILFLHQNFPGQYKHLAPALAEKGHTVTALVPRGRASGQWRGVRLCAYEVGRYNAPGIHPWLLNLESKVIRGEACFKAALEMKRQGYRPDVIIAHPGWGESLFLDEVWPDARIGIYCELFYQVQGQDIGYDREFATLDEGAACRLRLKNLNNALSLQVAHGGISPTRWQADTFPATFRPNISVVHDGIDTRALAPNTDAYVSLNTRSGQALRLDTSMELVTFVNRNLEPHRGYHIFMRAVPEILRRRPQARILLIGGDGVSYGAPPSDLHRNGGKTWKEIFATEARKQISDQEWERVHFLGRVGYEHFVSLMQLSSVHVYLTYPFILSWSLLEAMSTGAAVVASDTPSVREAVTHGENGRLVDFFDCRRLAEEVCELLADPTERGRLGANARASIQSSYDLRTVCLPAQLKWVDHLMSA